MFKSGQLGGGGKLEIGDRIAMHRDDFTFTRADGSIMKRTGILDDDLATYPQAKQSFYDLILGALENTLSNTGYGDITWDGTNYWVTSGNTNLVYQLTSSFAETGFSFPVIASPTGIAWNGTNLMVSNGSLAMTEYNTSGSVINVTGGTRRVEDGLVVANSRMWTCSRSAANLQDYSITGDSGITNTIIAPSSTNYGLAHDGGTFWLLQDSADQIIQIDAAGTTGFKLPLGANDWRGFEWNGTEFVLLSLTGQIYKVTKKLAVGDPRASKEGSARVYVKIGDA